MTLSTPKHVPGHEAELEAVIRGLDEELGLMPWESLCGAIRSGDMERVGSSSLELRGIKTIPPKKEAILAGRADILRLLLARDSFVNEDLVRLASECRDQQSLRVVLDSGWDINHPIGGCSVLCTAIEDVTFTQWLIDNGADVNLRSRLDETALSAAIAFGSMQVVQLLLHYGTDYSRGNLLHCAAQRSDEEEGAALIHFLAQNGAEVNACRYDNPSALRWRALFKSCTPLHIACERESILVARALLDCGADPQRMMLEAQRSVPPTPYEMAMRSKNEELIRLFVRRVATL